MASCSSNTSPLALFHSLGTIQNSLVLGSGCPPRLRPGDCSSAGSLAELIIIAPTMDECQQPGWFDQAAAAAGKKLSPTGIIYGLIPIGWRTRLLSLLLKQGFHVSSAYLHLPDWVLSRYIVPLESKPARYAFHNLIPTHPFKRRLMLALLDFPPGKWIIEQNLGQVGYLLTRPDGNKPGGWLSQTVQGLPKTENIVIATGKGDEDLSSVTMAFGYSPQPFAVAKVTPLRNPQNKQEAEATNLLHMREAAKQAGAILPNIKYSGYLGTQSILIEDCLNGQTLAIELKHHPGRLPQRMEQLVTWLEAWQQATCTRQDPHSQIEKEILAPLRFLNEKKSISHDYTQWLVERTKQMPSTLPLVASHNDLTTWNILIDSDQHLGIVDWQAARQESLPLGDFFYAIIDAVVVACHLDRKQALSACFFPNGIYFKLTARFTKRLCRALKIDPAVADILLHACFLQHAQNEQAIGEANFPQPFLHGLQMLIDHRTALQKAMTGGVE